MNVNEIKCNSLEETMLTLLKLMEERPSLKPCSVPLVSFKNYVTNKPYTGGSNLFSLWINATINPKILGESRSFYYVTTKQAHELGGRLKKECANWSKENKEMRLQIEELKKVLSNTMDLEKIEEIESQICYLRKKIKEHTIWEEIVYYLKNYYRIIKRDNKYIMQSLKYFDGELVVSSEKEVEETYLELYKMKLDEIKTSISARYYRIAPIEYFEGLKKIKGRTYAHNVSKTYKELWNTLDDYLKRENIKVTSTNFFKCSYSALNEEFTYPDISLFPSEEEALNLVSKNVIHSTGSKKRLNRDLSNDLVAKLKEELVCEMGSFFFLLEGGVLTKDVLRNKIVYIENYLAKINIDNLQNNLICAINNGRKAFEFLVSTDEDFGGDYED